MQGSQSTQRSAHGSQRSSQPRLRRAIKLRELLFHRGHTSAELARITNVSTRTVFRDLELLRESGVAVAWDKEQGGHYIVSSGDLPPPHTMSRQDLATLLVAATSSPLAFLPQLSDDLIAAINRLLGTLSHTERREISMLMADCVITAPLPAELATREAITRMLQAIFGRNSIRLTYRTRAEEFRTTKFAVYRLEVGGRRQIATGRSSVDRRIIDVDVNSITEVDILDEQYAVPQRFRARRWRERSVLQPNSP